MIHFDPEFAKQLWNKRPNQYNKDRYAKRKDEGLCVYCGSKIDPPGSVLCCECKNKNVESARYNRKKKKLIGANHEQREAD